MAEDDSKIDKLQARLYSPKAPDIIRKRHKGLEETYSDLQTDFVHDPEALKAPALVIPTSIFTKLFILSLLFLIISAGAAFLMYAKGVNVISPNNIDIQVSGPVTIPASQKIDFAVTVINENPEKLLVSDLVIDYPDGTRSSEDQTKPLVHQVVTLGDIQAGTKVDKLVSASLFGESDSKKQIRFTLQYRIPGSNSIFIKEKVYDVVIGAAPVSLTVDTLKEVGTNQDFTLKLHVTSNATAVIKNTLVTIAYPSGFTFKSASPQSINGTSSVKQQTGYGYETGNVWSLGDIEPGGIREIDINGSLNGQDTESKVFRIDLGSAASGSPQVIATKFAGIVQEIAVKQAFIATEIVLENIRGTNLVTSPKKNVSGKIIWKNNLLTSVTDPEFVLHLGGQLYDDQSVQAFGGFYRSSDNSIVWNSQTNSDINEIAPGQSGELAFNFNTIDPTKNSAIPYKNPSMTLDLSVSAKRLSEKDVPETIKSVTTQSLLFQTNLYVAAESQHATGTFANTGPIPPKINTPTTYTVVWRLSDGFNDAKDVAVSAQLPAYVTWLNQTSPSDERVVYNRARNEVMWQVGTIYSGTGIKTPPREISFQVSILPSISQLETTPALTGDISAIGSDAFTGVALSASVSKVTTDTKNDPGYVYAKSQVSN